MATLAQIRNQVKAKLAEGGGTLAAPTDSQIDAQINSVIQYYAKRVWWFSEDTVTDTLVTDDPNVPVPDDFGEFIQPDALVIEQNNVRWPVEQVTPLQFDSLYAGGNGLPRWFKYEDGAITLYFAPNTDYTYHLHYRKTYADLVADGDENDFTVYADRLIEYRALGECYRDYRSDAEMSAVHLGPDGSGEKSGTVYNELMNIRRQSYNRSATGNLTTESIVGRSRSTIYSTR